MPWSSEDMCKIAAKEFKDGFYANLGIGMPTKVANYIPEHIDITLQSENGLLGLGPFPTEDKVDPDLINAGKQTVTSVAGSSFFDNAASFAMIRGGHIDISILGALEVSKEGDLANWMVPGKMVKGPGGAMDLVAGVKRVVVLMSHQNKAGEPKILNKCKLPLTGKKVIDRVITELAVFDIIDNNLVLAAHANDITIEEVREKTEADFSVSDNLESYKKVS
jgi:3-oxoacid CoA-transferase subunit B